MLIATGTLLWGIDRSVRWVFTHTVDLPPGVLPERTVTADSSRTFFSLPATMFRRYADSSVECSVEVWLPGTPTTRPTGTTPVQVGDRPGEYAAPSGAGTDPYGVFWTGPDGAPANAACSGDDEPAASLTVAGWVRFGSQPVAVPFRLGSVSREYGEREIKIPESEWDSPRLVLQPTPGDLRPVLTVYRSTENQPAAGEPATVNGRRVVLDPYARRLCFTDPPVVCVAEDAIDHVGNDETWPDGVRQLLLYTAAGLQVAADLDDRTTWFPGPQVFPR